MRTKYIGIAIIIAVVALVSSCEYRFIEPIDYQFDGPVSFSEQIETIFQDKCTDCHSSTNPVLTTGNAYNNLIDGGYINTQIPEQSRIYKKTSDDHPGGSSSLTAEELAMLLQWIEEGAVNN